MLLPTDKKHQKTRYFARLVFLFALTWAVQLLGLPQFFTGPFINFMLILSSLLLNTLGGILLGCFTPIMAMLRGQLPAFLWPAIPFIMVGNTLFVSIFKIGTHSSRDDQLSRHWPSWLGLTLAAGVKFIWLYISAAKILPILLAKPLPSAFVAMMAIPQFITAIVGGSSALLFVSLLRHRKII